MTARRDVLIGIAGVAAAVAVPMKALAKVAELPINNTTIRFISGPFNIGELIFYHDGGNNYRAMAVTNVNGEAVMAGDLEADKEYTISLDHPILTIDWDVAQFGRAGGC